MSITENNKINVSFLSDDRSYPLETRLLMYFIVMQEGWALFNLIANAVFGAPRPMLMMFLILSIILPVYWLFSYILKAQELFIKAFYILYLLSMPLMWYFAGGTAANANVLFIGELIFYSMCLNGRVQKIFLILSIVSTAIISAISNMPIGNNPLELTQKEIISASRNLGLSTCILFTLLLLKQKQEYARERNAAINSEKELAKSNRLQKNFLANMSHEIRSPLGIVLGFNDLIAENNNIEQIHEYSANIADAGKTLQAVINDILDYSKIESGKLDIIDSDYSLNDLITGIRHDIGLKCDEKGLLFKIYTDESIPSHLYGDVIRIKQCLLNLLSNAVKYTNQGSVTLNISRLESDKEGFCRLKFDVTDTGRGISRDALPKLFDAFQRLDEGQNRGIEGTGLGLAITKNLLDEMHGQIEVSSEYGKGSTFTIYLDQKISMKSFEKKHVVNENTDISGLSILAVDDTKMNLTLINKLLSKLDAKITLIDNGADCLSTCKDTKFDVILLDHMMPEMDGVEVFKRLRNEEGLNRGTPVIMLTANAMAGAGKEYRDLGFNGYVSKPINLQELLKAISKCIN